MPVGTGRGIVDDATWLVIVRANRPHGKKAKWHAQQRDGRLYCGRLDLHIADDAEVAAGDFLEMREEGKACPMCAAALERRMRERR